MNTKLGQECYANKMRQTMLYYFIDCIFMFGINTEKQYVPVVIVPVLDIIYKKMERNASLAQMKVVLVA